jgi:predicted AAA+ superfamily ATPase
MLASYEKKLVISHEASAEIKPERAAVLVGLRRCGKKEGDERY